MYIRKDCTYQQLLARVSRLVILLPCSDQAARWMSIATSWQLRPPSRLTFTDISSSIETFAAIRPTIHRLKIIDEVLQKHNTSSCNSGPCMNTARQRTPRHNLSDFCASRGETLDRLTRFSKPHYSIMTCLKSKSSAHSTSYDPR